MSEPKHDTIVAELLRRARVEVAPATRYLVGFRHEGWRRLLENSEFSRRGSAPFVLLRDK